MAAMPKRGLFRACAETSAFLAWRTVTHLHLLRPQVAEGRCQQLGHLLVHIGRIVGEGGRSQSLHVPEGGPDGVLADDAEQVMQDLRVHLEARLVEGVCMATGILA